MDRRDVATWVSGPRAALEEQGIELGYRGERLGFPENGPGSVSGYGSRFGALFIDWVCCAVIVRLLLPQYDYGSTESAFATLGLFFLVKSLFTMLGGASFGQRIVGEKVIALDRPYVGPIRALLRSLLICLVVPAVIWDRDGRGLQDRLTSTAVVRAR